MNHLHWGAAFGAALGVHLVCAYVSLSWVPQRSHPHGAIDVGEGGVEIGLGRMGSYADLAARTEVPPPETPAEQQDTEPQNSPVNPAPPAPLLPEMKPVEVPAPEQSVAPVEKQTVVQKRPPVAVPDALLPPPEPQQPVQTKPTPHAEALPTTPAVSTAQPSPNRQVSAAVRATGKRHSRALGGRAGNPKDYFSLLIAWLNRHKDYPPAVKKKKQQGTVVLAFSINRSGEVLTSRVQQSSGHLLLDQAALDMLARANPLPAMPDSMPRQRLRLAVPIEYLLVTE